MLHSRTKQRQIWALFPVHRSVGGQNYKSHTHWAPPSTNILKSKLSILPETVAKTGFHKLWSWRASVPDPVCQNTKKPSVMSACSFLLGVLAAEADGGDPKSHRTVAPLDSCFSLMNPNFQKLQQGIYMMTLWEVDLGVKEPQNWAEPT